MSGAEERRQEEVKAEVRQTIRQLSEMTRSNASFDEFCDAVLSKVVHLTGAHGALLWQVNGGGAATVTHRAAGHLAERITPVAQEHATLVMDVVNNGQAMGLPSDQLASFKDAAQDSEQMHYLMLFSPVYNRENQCCGSIELLQRNDISGAAQEGYLKFLSQISQLFPRWHEHRDLTVLSKSAEKWTDKLEFTTEVHRTIDSNETHYAIANEARRLLGSDRVSVAQWTGRGCKIVAISSQDRFDNRANVVRKLGAVASAAASANSKFWIIGDTEGIAPEVADKINDYLDESHSRTLAVLPLVREPEKVDDLEMRNRSQSKVTRLGALMIEYFDADVKEDDIREDVDLIVKQSQLAMDNSHRHSEIFMLPLWQRLGWLQQLLFRDHYAKTMTALACLGILLLFMIFYPGMLKMKVDGVMQPQLRRNVFAQTDGIIREVLVDNHQPVAQGDKLLKMENKELELEITDLEGQIDTTRKQIEQVEMQLSQSVDLEEDRLGLDGQLQQLEIQLQNFIDKRKLLEIKRKSLEVFSPIDGRVVTWEAKRRLTDFPVSANQIVMSVADFDGKWQLELRIPQNKVGYVTKALAENDNEPLDVEFVLGTNANLRAKGKLIRIADRADVSEAGIPEFRAIVEANLDNIAIEELRPGAGVTAKIKCGRHRLGFVWFYQILDFLRTKVFF